MRRRRGLRSSRLTKRWRVFVFAALLCTLEPLTPHFLLFLAEVFVAIMASDIPCLKDTGAQPRAAAV